LQVLAVAVVAILLVGVTLAIRSRQVHGPAPVELPQVSASPSPSVEPSLTPAPTATPKREIKKPEPQPKKESKARSFVKKVKRILKKPF
jgi:hypothetical protein